VITLKLICPLCTDEMRAAGLSRDITITAEQGDAELQLVKRAFRYNWGPVPGYYMVCGMHRLRKSMATGTYVLSKCTYTEDTSSPVYKFKAWEVD
jgi:hypothetical protein